MIVTMMLRFISILLALQISLYNSGVAAITRRFEFNITMAMINPDCFNQSYTSPVVNGQFPGPTIRVVQGDDVEVLVRNQMSDRSTTVHFHGIRQYGTVESDGVPFLTQAPIAPGDSFLHRFRVTNQSGTYFYHAHLGMQADTLHGAFIVHENEESIPTTASDTEQALLVQRSQHYHHHHHHHHPQDKLLRDGPYHYDDERIIQLNEWWHTSLEQREAELLGPQAASILFNGRTMFDALSDRQNDPACPGFTTFLVEQDKAYRFRVIGSNTFLILGLSIMDHTMTIIEVDGELVEPYETDTLEVAPGQRFSVLVKTTKKRSSSTSKSNDYFVIATTYRWRNLGEGYTDNGYAYLQYVDKSTANINPSPSMYTRVPIAKDQLAPVPTDADQIDWIWPELSPLRRYARNDDHVLNKQADRTLKLRAMEISPEVTDDPTLYYINGRLPIHLQPSVILYDILKSPVDFVANSWQQLEPDGYNAKHQTFPIHYGEIVDIVLQNTLSDRTGTCFAHPWHSHGHSHYLLATGPGEYDFEAHKDIRNMPRPLYKDVSMVYPSVPQGSSLLGDDGRGCGWTKIRIIADNPGIWALHCHVTSHLMQGKIVALEEAPELIESHRLYKQ